MARRDYEEERVVTLPVNGVWRPVYPELQHGDRTADFYAYQSNFTVTSPTGVEMSGDWLTRDKAEHFAVSMGNYPEKPRVNSVPTYWYIPAWGRADDPKIVAWQREHGHASLMEEAPRRHVARDFSTLPEIVEHARLEGATHVVLRPRTRLFYPVDGGYEEAAVWQEHGYWHAPAPSDRPVVSRLPQGAELIETYLARGGQRAAESSHFRVGQFYLVDRATGASLAGPFDTRVKAEAAQHGSLADTRVWQSRGTGDRPTDRVVRDYVPVDHRGRPIGPPTKDYGAAKAAADRARGYVKYAAEARRAPAADVWYEPEGGLLEVGWYATLPDGSRVGPFVTRSLAQAARRGEAREPDGRRRPREARTNALSRKFPRRR